MNNKITLVYTSSLEKTSFVNECKEKEIKCIPAVDSRSAVYIATGICAQTGEKVAVCVDAGNESRSAFSGMTEAFYRKLPVALITLGEKLDYTRELNDIVVGHYRASSFEELDQLLSNKFPMHIELLGESQIHSKMECNHLQKILCSVLDEKSYLYISNAIKKTAYQYKAKVVYGGMPDCYEGALANVLGASLAKKHEKYVGLVSEDEFRNDINTLGNVNINDRLVYIVVGNTKNVMFADSVAALKFEVNMVKTDKLEEFDIKGLCSSKKKSLLFVYEED